MTTLPDFAAIRVAHARIRPHVRYTPVLTSSSLDAEIGARLFFKCENFQKVGAFKARGASNAVFSLTDDDARRGVITHSSGNHGAALAYAAARRGIPAWIVMPDNAAQVKLDNVRRQGGTVHLCRPTVAAREAMCAEVQASTGATLVHPFDDERIALALSLSLSASASEAKYHVACPMPRPGRTELRSLLLGTTC